MERTNRMGIVNYKLDFAQRCRAGALTDAVIADPEAAAAEIIWLRDNTNREKAWDAALEAAAEYVERIGNYGCENMANAIREIAPPEAETE